MQYKTQLVASAFNPYHLGGYHCTSLSPLSFIITIMSSDYEYSDDDVDYYDDDEDMMDTQEDGQYSWSCASSPRRLSNKTKDPLLQIQRWTWTLSMMISKLHPKANINPMRLITSHSPKGLWKNSCKLTLSTSVASSVWM